MRDREHGTISVSCAISENGLNFYAFEGKRERIFFSNKAISLSNLINFLINPNTTAIPKEIIKRERIVKIGYFILYKKSLNICSLNRVWNIYISIEYLPKKKNTLLTAFLKNPPSLKIKRLKNAIKITGATPKWNSHKTLYGTRIHI